jgi:hypothetical protein
MEQQVHTFTKGMNKDFHPTLLQEGQYNEAWNAVLQNRLQGNSYTLNNEPGFAPVCRNDDLINQVFFLSLCPINSDIVAWCIRINDVVGAINAGLITETGVLNPALLPDGTLNTFTSSEVGIFRSQIEGDYIYEVVVNDKDQIYWDSDNVFLPDTLVSGRVVLDELWNFDINNQIQSIARIDHLNRPVVYWTDGINDPRFLVLDIDYTDDINKKTFKYLAQQTKLMQVYNLPYIQYNRQLAGGNITPGVYQFSARYLNETLDPTTFGYLSNVIPVVDDQRSDGRDQYDGAPFDGPTVSKSIELIIHNVDQNYQYLEIAVIAYRTAASTPIVRMAQRVNIQERTSIRFVFDGTIIGEEISLEELLRVPVVYHTAEHILQKDGRLFLANLKTNPAIDLQDMANNLLVKYTVRDIPFVDDPDYFNDYKEENNTFNFKGYRRDEVYSFGIVGIFKDGTQSFVANIPGLSAGVVDEDRLFDENLSIGNIYAPILFDNTPTGGIGTFNSEGYLNPYISSEYYPDAPLVTVSPPYYYCRKVDEVTGEITPIGGEREILTGRHLRFHKMPSVDQEPYIYKDIFGNDWLRILGIQIEGIEEYLSQNETLRKQLLQIVVVRQKRDRLIDKSILSQGCLNRLNLQNGRKVSEPKTFEVDYKLGVGKLPIDFVNHLAEAIFTIANPLYSIGLRNLNFNGRLEPYDINRVYSVDPYWGNTIIKADNQVIFYNGDFQNNDNVERRNDHFAFFSPESNFSKSFNIPGDGWIEPVMCTSGIAKRSINTRTVAFTKFIDGSYNSDYEAPYNSLYRGPYYHLFVDFKDKYLPIAKNDALRFRVPRCKKVRWNDAVLNNGNIFELPTKVSKPNPFLTSQEDDKINAYETEGFVMVRVQRDDFNPLTPIIATFYPSPTPTSPIDCTQIGPIEIVIGAKFNILFAPYLPIWLLQIIKDTADYGTPDDVAAPLGAGLEKVAKVTIFIANIAIGVAVAIIELVFIRGAVVDVREVKDEYNFLKRGTGRYAGRNSLSICGSIAENVDTGPITEASLALSNAIQLLQPLVQEREELIIERKSLQRKIDTRSADIAAKEAQLEKLNKELDKLKERLDNASSESEKDALNSRINQKKQEISDVEDDLDELNDDILYARYVARIVEINNRLAELDVEIAAQQAEVDAAKQNLKEIQESYSNVSSGCPQNRYIYNVGYNNERQYGQLGLNPYIPVEVLFSDRSIIDNYTYTRVEGSVQTLPGYQFLKEIIVDGRIVSVFYQADDDLTPYEFTERTKPLFNGDTFITKYFFKVSHNVACAVPNIGQNNLNRYTLERMYKGGGSLIIGPAFLPIPNFLAFPGSAFAASVSDGEGRLFNFIGGISEDPDTKANGIESVRIINERMADPLYPAREGFQMRGGNWVWLESDINTEYRHRPVSYTESSAKAGGFDQFANSGDQDNPRLGVPYFPKDSLQWCFEVSPEFGQSNGYNQQYSIQNDLQKYFTKPFGQVQPSIWPNRIIYSEPIDSPVYLGKPSKSELSDKYRLFLPFSYQDLPKNKGAITNIFEFNTFLYAHTERSLWRTFVNTRAAIPTTTGEIFTGTGGVFQQPPQEVMTLSGGYAGCLHKWACVGTPFGYIFPDFLQKKVFRLTEQLEEVSSSGLYNWFLENMTLQIKDGEDQITNKYYNNPANPNGVGLVGFYDPEFKRYVLGIKTFENILTVDTNSYTVDYQEFVEKDTITNREYSLMYKTVSLSIQDNAWVSFHNYIPAIAVTNDLYVFSTGNFNVNNLFAHNKVIGRNSRSIYGIYGIYYKPEIFPFIVQFSINQNPGVTKVYDNLVVYATLYNETTPEGIKHHGDFFQEIQCWNDSQHTGTVPIIIYPYSINSLGIPYDELEANCKIYNNEFRLSLPSSAINNVNNDLNEQLRSRYSTVDVFNPANITELDDRPRLKDKYLVVRLKFNNNSKTFNNAVDFSNKDGRFNLAVSLSSIISKFRINSR